MAAAVALLWDLDNVSVSRDDLPDLARALAALVPPQAPRIVAAHYRAYRTHRDMLAEQSFRVLCGGNQPEGTDGVLLRQARRLRRKRGIGQFVLASNDRDFARIATFGSLHVVTLDPTRLSARLRDRANAVTVLARAPAGWRTTTVEPS
ncbi:NYN domain-containing protein [Blastococcus sp. TF02A_35]|uniref:NYN domain-containing protein n=1 Tax=Blastococcus sp. TF02A-35 TaxID=2559612 RepID=UPI0010734445|nr:NYN domain-containing protein [Blastococcus sp. TF02A_35]